MTATLSVYANNSFASKAIDKDDLIEIVQKDVTYKNLLSTISSIDKDYFVDKESLLKDERGEKWAVQLSIKNEKNDVAGFYYLTSDGVSCFQDISGISNNKIINYNLNDGSISNFIIENNQIKEVINVSGAKHASNLKKLPYCDIPYAAACATLALASGTGTFGFGVCMLFCG